MPRKLLPNLVRLASLVGVFSVQASAGRERTSINTGWKFWRSEKNPDGLIYDHRPDLAGLEDAVVLKPWILPSANDFITDTADRYSPPDDDPKINITFVQQEFDDSKWQTVRLPHDWAISGPFYDEEDPIIGGGMGRLPVHGVGWYRRKLTTTSEDKGKKIYLEIDGAMSYAMVWLNGKLIGGWPYPYNSFRLDLTQHLEIGQDNQLAIRLDNPPDSARWYPGGGIYRNVWITKVGAVHVARYGTFITTRNVSSKSATLDLMVEIKNHASESNQAEVVTEIYAVDSTSGQKNGGKKAEFPRSKVTIASGGSKQVNSTVTLKQPLLWGPPPRQTPNLYLAVTMIYVNGRRVDSYETQFGVRSVEYDPEKGVLVNGEKVPIQGVNQHHDLGALGAAFNVRAAERQLEVLQELGCNAIRMSHNPPAPELLDLTDRMGFLVMDEIFDVWKLQKTTSDFHLIFGDWHEADLRAFVRRDRNHASIITWSFGNEVGEQQTAEDGAMIGLSLHKIVSEEDPTRPSTASMNYAMPDMPFGHSMDVLSINYQGSGIRDTPAYSFLSGIHRQPMYPAFQEAFPDKMMWGSETASSLSTRGTFMFPVADLISAPVNDSSGGNSTSHYVSAYEIYSADFGSSIDKVWMHQDGNPYVAGEFVWSGWDYLGEPTPYYSSRSSYCGIIDLAGFKKERFYAYQARWRPDLPTAHILPHWNWPERVGKVTPVHVFSAADEAELFLNGKSQGRQKRETDVYRFRWDSVEYHPGELRVKTYRDGKKWAEDSVQTTGKATKLRLVADRTTIGADGEDLSFIRVEVVDKKGNVVPQADNLIEFTLSGPGEVVATDNGDPTDLVAFPSLKRNAFSGLALAIVRAEVGGSGRIIIKVASEGLSSATLTLDAR